MRICSRKSFEVELSAEHALGVGVFFALRCFVGRDDVLDPSDERAHVAHAEDPVGEAGRLELLQARPTPSPRPMNLIGLPVTLLDRECGATARVTVELGHDEAVELEAFVELACAVVTASCPIIASTTSRMLCGAGAAGGLLELCHEQVVDGETARGVDDHRVAAGRLGARTQRRASARSGGFPAGVRVDREPRSSRRARFSWSMAAGR
jgi:hypothetical protein